MGACEFHVRHHPHNLLFRQTHGIPPQEKQRKSSLENPVWQDPRSTHLDRSERRVSPENSLEGVPFLSPMPVRTPRAAHARDPGTPNAPCRRRAWRRTKCWGKPLAEGKGQRRRIAKSRQKVPRSSKPGIDLVYPQCKELKRRSPQLLTARRIFP